MNENKGRVLIVAGSDSGGGAGIQADIKTVTALGGYAMTAVTAITVQNTLGVSAVHPVPPDIVRAQIEAVADDLGADVWKLGMLGAAQTIRLVARAYQTHGRGAPLVLDPVMIAKGGARLLDDDALDALRDLVRIAAIVTPNAPEAEALVGFPVTDAASQRRAGEALLKMGAQAALVKGGHIPGDQIVDVLLTANSGSSPFEVILGRDRIRTKATHGTGCTLASGIAVRMAQGASAGMAYLDASNYLMEAIARAPGFGAGHGPLNHGWPFQRG